MTFSLLISLKTDANVWGTQNDTLIRWCLLLLRMFPKARISFFFNKVTFLSVCFWCLVSLPCLSLFFRLLLKMMWNAVSLFDIGFVNVLSVKMTLTWLLLWQRQRWETREKREKYSWERLYESIIMRFLFEWTIGMRWQWRKFDNSRR